MALSGAQKIAIAGVAAGSTGLLSLFNIVGRFFWASFSDRIGRKITYAVSGVPRDQVYDKALDVLAGLLAVGLVANLLVRPVAPRWLMDEAGIAEAQHGRAPARTGAYGIGRCGWSGAMLLAWAVMAIPLAWGVWRTVITAMKLFA